MYVHSGVSRGTVEKEIDMKWNLKIRFCCIPLADILATAFVTPAFGATVITPHEKKSIHVVKTASSDTGIAPASAGRAAVGKTSGKRKCTVRRLPAWSSDFCFSPNAHSPARSDWKTGR